MVVKINEDYEIRIKEEDIIIKDKKLYNLTTKKFEAADGDIVEFISEKDGVRRWHRGYVDGYSYGDRIPLRGIFGCEYHNITYKKIEHISSVSDPDGLTFEQKELQAATEAL